MDNQSGNYGSHLIPTISNQIIEFWFSTFKKYWFNAPPEMDQLAAERFRQANDTLHANGFKFSGLSGYLEYFNAPDISLSMIIIYDQLYRHYKRVNSLDADPYNDTLVKVVLTGLDGRHLEKLTPEQQCFYLMPLRHSGILKYIRLAIDTVSRLDSQSEAKRGHAVPAFSIYHRFLKAAYTGFKPILLDYARQLNSEVVDVDASTTNSNIDTRDVWPIIDKSRLSKWARFKIWLAFDSVDVFRPDQPERDNQIFASVLRQVLDWQSSGVVKRKVVISLSGGVDSTTVAWCLVELRRIGILDTVIAVHINYGNRQVSDLEELFVKRWCGMAQLPLHVRRITELTRGHWGDRDQTASNVAESRQFYESYTRQVRFDLYSHFKCPVFLGHNRDDVFENIFTNIAKSQHYENLAGMTPVGRGPNGVVILRPLLTTDKTDIVTNAVTLNLFHTQNSTPVWSKRYMIRNRVMIVFEQYFPAFLDGLEQLGGEMSSSLKDIDRNVDIITEQSKTTSDENKVTVTMPRDLISSDRVWSKLLLRLHHHQGLRAPSHRSMDNSFSVIRAKTSGRVNLSRASWVVMSKGSDKNLVSVVFDRFFVTH